MPARTLRYTVRVAGRELGVTVDPESGGRQVVTSDGVRFDDVTVLASGPTLTVRIGDRTVEVVPSADGTSITLPGGGTLEIEPERRGAAARLSGGGSPGNVQAPMPGRVLKVLVTEGETVEAGAGLVVIEAMKMENEITAPSAGAVRRVLVQAGDAVERDALLVELA